MAGKKMRLRGIKHTPKRLESDILERSKALWEDPSLIRPKCAGKCFLCPFDKTFSSISKIGKIKEDPEALIKMASKGGDDLLKAYCATISLYAAGSVPYLATARLAGEEVSYAQRGSVGNDKLIGMQYYNDPKIRLLMYNGIAKKKGLHIYSFGDEIVCSKKPNMPVDYIYDTFWDTPYEFENDEITCGHHSDGILVIRVKSADTEIRICKDCAKEVSTLQFLISRFVGGDPLDDVEVFVEHSYHSEGSEGRTPVTGDNLKRYSVGAMTDVSVLNMVLKGEIGSLKSSDSATYIIGTKNYGSDLDSFLGDLTGTEAEMLALRSYLANNTSVSVIAKNNKASDALLSVWGDARKVIASFTNDDIANSFSDPGKMNPSQAIKDAYQKYISHDVVSKLPEFKRPGDATRHADAYAKAYKVGGADMLKERMSDIVPKDKKMRAMAKAFCDIAEIDMVKCSGDEVEFSQFLRPFVEQLIDAEGEDYRDKMNTLLTALGCGESV